eukprot:gene26681-65772_t
MPADEWAAAAAPAARDPDAERMLDEWWVAARRGRDYDTADRLRQQLRENPPTIQRGVLLREKGVVITGGRCYRAPVRSLHAGRGQGEEDGMCVDADDSD